MNYLINNVDIASIKINPKSHEYHKIMEIYQLAMELLLKKIEKMQMVLNAKLGYEAITKVTNRIKSSKSILNKLNKKRIDPNYGNLIDDIKDISGVRIVTSFEDDIYLIKEIISKMDGVIVLEEKNYLTKGKDSGYRAYHLIVGVLVDDSHYINVEIQIRTVLMDFWASVEHRVKYKKQVALSLSDSHKLTMYAKVMSYLGMQMEKIYRKQEKAIES